MTRALRLWLRREPPPRSGLSGRQPLPRYRLPRYELPRYQLPRRFYARDVLSVAPDLVGRWLRRDDVIVRITEVEAYRWPGDSACHARHGRTARNAALWGPPAHAYVYLCYGLHQMLNIVADDDGRAAAVLVRACEPVAGLDTIVARRAWCGRDDSPALLAGPGKVGAALGLDVTWSGHALYRRGGLEVLSGTPPERISVGPRVGIDYATPADRDAPWRFADAGSRWVSQRGTLNE